VITHQKQLKHCIAALIKLMSWYVAAGLDPKPLEDQARAIKTLIEKEAA